VSKATSLVGAPGPIRMRATEMIIHTARTMTAGNH